MNLLTKWKNFSESIPQPFTNIALSVMSIAIIFSTFSFNASLLNGLHLESAAISYGSGDTYYVAPNGSDTADGKSVTTPFKTVQKAADVARSGDTVLIRGGTYREQVTIRNAGRSNDYITFTSYPGEKVTFKATDIVTGWTNYQGNIWKVDNWNYDSQQVFVDFDSNPGEPLEQIKKPTYPQHDTNMGKATPNRGLSDMKAGSFFYDPASGSLYVWLADGSDPNSHIVEAGKRAMNISVAPGVGYIYIKNLTFRFGNTGTVNYFPIVNAGPGGVIENCDIQWADQTGVYISNGGQLLNSIVSNNGNNGVGASGPNNIISGNTIRYNNYRHYYSNHMGGLKLIPDFGGVIEKNDISYNYGMGLWIDTNYAPGSVGPVVDIRYNTFRENTHTIINPNTGQLSKEGLAIFYEISQNARIHDNIFIGDNGRGIYISASNKNKIYNNSMVGNSTYNTLDISNAVLSSTYTISDNSAFNNLIQNDSYANNQLLLLNGYSIATHAFNNTSDYNLYYIVNNPTNIAIAANGSSVSGSRYFTLSTWRAFSGQDTHSVNADPQLVSASVSGVNDIKLEWNSPAIDAGVALQSVNRERDYFGNPIYGAPDIGAFEYQPPYRIGSDNIDIGADVRVYADGKFRNKKAPTGTAISMGVTPYGGFPGNTKQWLDIDVSVWNTSGDYKKTWVGKMYDIGNSKMTYTVGGFKPSTYYQVSVNGIAGEGITRTGYANGVAGTNSSGTLSFTFTGDYSNYTFSIQEFLSGTPVVSNDAQDSALESEIANKIATAPIQRAEFDLANAPVTPEAQARLPEKTATNTPAILPVAGDPLAQLGAGLTLGGLVDPCATTTGSSTNASVGWTIPPGFKFTKTLTLNAKGLDVVILQYILAKEGILASTGITGTYDTQTTKAVSAFQKKYKIVSSGTPSTTGFGRVGPKTIVKFNQFLGASKYGNVGSALGANCKAYTFKKVLKLGTTDVDVKYLQRFLNNRGFTVALTGPGSKGQESAVFDNNTKLALIKFQEAYASEILRPVGLTKGTGNFGLGTMKKVNALGGK